VYFPGEQNIKRGSDHDVVQQTENPYYGYSGIDKPTSGRTNVTAVENPYYGVVDSAIKKSANPYYGRDPELPLPPHVIEVKDNPYYDVEPDATDMMSNNNINVGIENAVIVQITENPYYVDLDDITGQEHNTSETVEDSTIVNKKNRYYVKMDSIELENDNVSE
jgi:hypothetical protein